MHSQEDRFRSQFPDSRRPFLCDAAEADWLWHHTPPAEIDVELSLFIHAVFGHLLYVSDWFSLWHPSALKLLRDEKSLLREMLYTKYARFVTLCTSLDELSTLATGDRFKHVSRRGVSDWKRLIATAWERNDVLQLPRNRSALGFFKHYSPAAREQHAVEFRFYPPDEFKTIVGSGSNRGDSVTKGVDPLPQPYQPRTTATLMSHLMGAGSQSIPLREQPAGKADLLWLGLAERTIWRTPVVSVHRELVGPKLNLLRRFVDLGSWQRELVRSTSTKIYRLLTSGSARSLKGFVGRLNKIVEGLLSELATNKSRVASLIKRGEVDDSDYVTVTLRHVLPAVLSADESR